MSLFFIITITIIYVVYSVIRQHHSPHINNNPNERPIDQPLNTSENIPPHQPGYEHISKKPSSIKNHIPTKHTQKSQHTQQPLQAEITEEDTQYNLLPDFSDEQQTIQAIVAAEILNRKYV